MLKICSFLVVLFIIIYFKNNIISPFFSNLNLKIAFGFPCGSAGKESACNAGDLCSIPGLGRSPGEGKGYPLQYSGLENSMDCIVYRVAKSWTRLSDFHSPTHCVPLIHASKESLNSVSFTSMIVS